MPNYKVSVYRELQLVFEDIEADNYLKAAEIAVDMPIEAADAIDKSGPVSGVLTSAIRDDGSAFVKYTRCRPEYLSLLGGLEGAVQALKVAPSFDTGIVNPKDTGRTYTSGELLRFLKAIVRGAKAITPLPKR